MGSRRSRSEVKNNEVLFKVRCNGEEHTVRFRGHRVTLLDHPGVRLKTLAAEVDMMEQSKIEQSSCLEIVGALLCGGSYFAALKDRIDIPHLLEGNEPREVRNTRYVRRTTVFDPLEGRRFLRPSPFVLAKAREVLERWQLRSTPNVGHDVKIYSVPFLTRGEIVVTCTKRGAYPNEVKIAAKLDARRAKWRQVVAVSLDEASWARIYLRCGGLIEGKYFVTQLVKERSPFDLRVRYAYQSRGYKIATGEGNIRLGSDGVWRLVG